MKKMLYIMLGVVIFILLLGGMFYHMFVVSPARYEDEQNNYFSKVDYDFSGTVKKFQYLGGCRCLLYIKVKQIDIKKNKLSKGDDFVGYYSKEDDLIILFADFDLLINERYNSLEKGEIEEINVEINVKTSKKKIYYFNANAKERVGETDLSPTHVYLNEVMFQIRCFRKTAK